MSKNNGWLKSKDQVNGLLDKGCSVDGKIVFDGTVQINGEFNGEVSSEGTLIVGQDARLSGQVVVDTLICYGTVDGKVDAKTRIEIRVPSVVTADISTKSLMIEEGALFQGRCFMQQPSKVEELPKPSVINTESDSRESVAV
ncbi:MAG: polymer-forming cytoskeletal protein [Deltaproteobacteria bacterium]|nr:polymer-forming cytoskeletal protein [Deltaproteobacteria bacterium]